MIDEDEIKKLEPIGPNRFSFNGNIINEIGEESISNPFIAIAELIKNSYDADSEHVSINFHNIAKHNPKLVISDDGVGMDFPAIKDRWMEIGSPHKKDIELTSEQERIPVGAKGIGRFSSHCLGRSMKLITASQSEHFGHRLTFDWEKFSSKIKATDVDIETQRFKKKLSTRGTTLVVENLKQSWNDGEKLRRMLKDLYLLTSPVDLPKNFRISENLNPYSNGLKKLNQEFLNKAAYSLKINLLRGKEVEYKFFKNGMLVKSEKKVLTENLSCGDVSFELYFYYKTAQTWQKWLKKEITKKELEEIKQMLADYGGIKLYRDKFRVKPYGDDDSDWIGLDRWSRDTSTVPGNTQVIGFVTISREKNKEIQDTTSREGVIATPSYFDLVKYVTTAIKIFVELKNDEESEKAKAKKASTAKRKAKGKITVETPKVEEKTANGEENFISVNKGSYPNIHYNQLVFEANGCKRRDYPNAAFWISRKIVENLVFNILEKKYPGKIDLWFDKSHNRNQTFSKLIEGLYSNKADFEAHSKSLIEQFNIDVGKFKKAVDATIHNNPIYLTASNEIDQYKVNKIIQMLIDVYARIR